jgi:Flp pilus assembly protein TadG
MNLIPKNILALGKQYASGRNVFSKKGVAAVEFALTLPMLIMLLLGVGDGSYYLLVNEKVDRIAYTVTDMVTQYKSITKANIEDIFAGASLLMSPFPFASKGYVVVSSYYLASGNTNITLCWNMSSTTDASVASDITISGATLVLPNGQSLTINPNENVIISEVYYNFTPMFLSSGLFKSGKIFRLAVYKPRLSLLITAPS